MASLRPIWRAGEDYERIDASDLASLMNDCKPFEKLAIVDCRSRFEYNGGHIRSARRCQAVPDFEQLFQDAYAPHACFVFHCEFSRIRAPAGLSVFRTVVEKHAAVLPRLFVLDKGYRNFYAMYSDLCVSGYTPQPA